MFHFPFDSFRTRVKHARESGDLYFASLISKECIEAAFGDASCILNSARIYTTSVTVWAFLSQVMSIHHGCIAAVTKLISFRVARGLAVCSAETGAYCIARDKLDESSMQRLVNHSGRHIEEKAPKDWRWLGRRVLTGDGTTVTMADTAENQVEYPQQRAQSPGCGFPIMRVFVLFAMATGTVIENAVSMYRGKGTHEVCLFRSVDSCIEKGDVYLADRAYSGWFDMARLMLREVDVVVRKHQFRRTDFRIGKRLSTDDHVIKLAKPSRPDWMSKEEYATYPEFISIRETRIRVEHKGFRTQEIHVHTSLLDDITYSKQEIAMLFRRRWEAELNLRSLKWVMQMDHLRCKKPHRVRNELRAHLLAYNLVRQVMFEASVRGNVKPWQISFKATLTSLTELLPILGVVSNVDELCDAIVGCCLQHAVGRRPDRYEPRVVKRRPKTYKLMQKPRSKYKPSEI